MFDCKKPYIEFCCMAHETFFSEDFISDDEDFSLAFSLNFTNNISFMPPFSDEVSKELSNINLKEEAAVQCDTKSPQSLSHLSSLPVFSLDSFDKVLKPSTRIFEISHTPKVFLPDAPLPEAFVCKHCKQSFKSGQALGGHISKKH